MGSSEKRMNFWPRSKKSRPRNSIASRSTPRTAQPGDVALTQLRYPDAAKRFAEAAAKLPEGHGDERWICLNLEADALYRQGDEFGDNAAAALAERYRDLAESRPESPFHILPRLAKVRSCRLSIVPKRCT
jgi:hypothetical protein